MKAFHDIVHTRHGIPCTVRQEKGQEVSGACGQLAVVCKTGAGASDKLPDIEEIATRLAQKAL